MPETGNDYVVADGEKVSRTELTPTAFLERSAAVFPDRVAVAHGDRRYTYRQFMERARRLGSALRRSGLTKHDRVAILSPNTPAMLEAHYGVPASGGVLVTINTRLSSDEIRYILGDSGARFAFVDAELEGLIEDPPRDLHTVRIDDTGEPTDPYEDFLSSGRTAPLESWLEDEEEPVSINYTSGTTGKPKGVVYTHRGAYLNALGEIIEVGLGQHPVYLWTLPMFHCNGWCFTWAVTAAGGRHVCLRKVDPARIWALLHSEGVTHMNGAPAVWIGLANAREAERLEKPVTVTVAGAPPSPTLLARMDELNLRAVHVYGLTETYGPITVCAWQDGWSGLEPDSRASFLARQGQAYCTADPIRVVDEEMNDVPRDGATMGEVVMRGNNVMSGYFDDAEATEKAFTGGWFHSGDLAVQHPDGYIEVRDRAKDVVISGGENISTIEVEQVLTRHPSVLECAVIAVPNQRWGERPKAFVTLLDGGEADERELIEFCRDRLAHFKCPDSVEFGALPKTSTGKVQKVVLREREWEGHERRVH